MCAFDGPEKAFTASSYRPRTATVPVRRVDLRLRAFEMLVASSNNEAVENISRELPALKAIADDAPPPCATSRRLRTTSRARSRLGGSSPPFWGMH